MTNSGKRIWIQITFDVMNVGKLLLSTSALKRRGITIIFNHDYDRIILQNETVNLVSHDCHSCLHVTLANGTPLRKAMVMPGENATNDLDEEVYGNDGAERHEAKSARILRTLEPPTDAARMAHNATHVPFRDWCTICVASRGRSSPHRRVVVNKTADALPKFQTDYMFVHSNSGREQNSAVYHIRGNAQWSGDASCAPGKEVMRNEGNPTTF